MSALEEYERGLFERLEGRMRALDGVTVYGSPSRRTPTLLFSLDGRSSHDVHVALAARGVNAPAGSFYALEASRWAGLGDTGAVRAGIAAYTNDADVDRLVAAVSELVK
jgi:selenocysteine lyase/cysteine desulfurase